MVDRGSATVRAPGQVRALGSPVRQEIVDVLEAVGSCSVARLAELTGRAADSLYHHLRKLVRVGLVVEVERRKEGRQVFALYDLAVRPVRVSYAPPVAARDVARVVGSAQRMAWREFQGALLEGVGVHGGARRTLWGARAKGWLSGAQIERVNVLLEELLGMFRGSEPGGDREAISLSFLLAPARAGRRARASGGARGGSSRLGKKGKRS